MSSTGHFILMDFVFHRFHIYHGDMNDASTWKRQGESYVTHSEASGRCFELDEAGDNHELTTPHQ